MKNNLDLMRAENALKAASIIGRGKDGGEVVKKVPAYIINDGFLAAAAFAEANKGGYGDVFAAIAHHLKSVGRIDIADESAQGLIKYLVGKDSSTLRDVTAEAMLFLSYLRRFVKKCDGSER